MNIVDISGGLPRTTLGVLSQASYRLVGIPPGGGRIDWALTGDDDRWSLVADDPPERARVMALHASSKEKFTVLTATFMPAGGGAPSVASLQLTAFELSLVLDQSSSDAVGQGRWLGVGETRILQAREVPEGALDSDDVEWDWAVGPDLQIGGDGDGPTILVVAQSATNQASVSVSVAVEGATSEATLELTAWSVEIVGRGDAAVGFRIPVGLDVEFGALVLPSENHGQLFWGGESNLSLAARGSSVLMRGFLPSVEECADTLSVHAVIGGAQARDHELLTVYTTLIGGVGGTPARPSLPVNAQQGYSVRTVPPLDGLNVAWSVQGPAAIVGPTNQADVQLLALAPGSGSAEVVLSVWALPPGLACERPTASLAITIGKS